MLPPPFERSTRADVHAVDERRNQARLAQLTRTHDELCTQAVDAFEIAAGLEAAGVSDRQARTVYGAASVFELAEAMYGLVPRRPSNAGAPTDPWQRPLARHLLRGLLYGLPGLMYAVALARLHSGFGALLLLGATVVASGLGQELSLLGHVLIGRGDRRAARRLLRGALVCGALLLASLAVAGWLSGSLLPTAVLAGCQVEYLVAATVLMVMDADLLLLAVLTPGVLLATAVLTGVAGAAPRAAVLGLLALCVVGAVVAAGSQLTEAVGKTARHPREAPALSGADRALGSTYLVYGTANAGLLSFAVVDLLGREGGAAGGQIALMMLPLVGCLGIAEWLVHHLRSRALTALQQTTSVTAFRLRARSELGRAVLGYGAVLTLLTCAVVTAVPGPPDLLFALRTCAYGVLGLAFLLETLLLSLGRNRLALGLATSALVVDTALRWALAPYSAETVAVMHLAVFTGLLLIALPLAASQFGSVGAHR